MANQEHLDLLKQGVEVWNRWREDNPDVRPELRRIDFRNIFGENSADLTGINFSRTHLEGSLLFHINLYRANLKDANVRMVHFVGVNLREANLEGAWLSGSSFTPMYSDGGIEFLNDLSGANLRGAALNGCDLEKTIMLGTNLRGATLTRCRLIQTNLEKANLADCRVYGISVWNVQLQEATQLNLIITDDNEPTITVDDLEVAQFIYLLLNNQKIRYVIDSITSKVVLILGRFTPERKIILDAIRDELRKRNYTPVLFDFEKPANRDLTETVSTLAHLARFIIVDLTDPSSAPHEVATIIPQTVVPVQPLLTLQSLIVEGKAVERREYAMFEDLRRRYHWILPTFRYQDTADLLASLKEHIIDPAEQKAKELAKR